MAINRAGQQTSQAWDCAECYRCGTLSYRKHFLYRDGQPFCDDCAEQIGLIEENQDRVAEEESC